MHPLGMLIQKSTYLHDAHLTAQFQTNYLSQLAKNHIILAPCMHTNYRAQCLRKRSTRYYIDRFIVANMPDV